MALRYLPLLLLVCCLSDLIAVKARIGKQEMTKADTPLGSNKEDASQRVWEEGVKSHGEHASSDACVKKVRQTVEYNSDKDTDGCSTRDDGGEGFEKGAKEERKGESGAKTGDLNDERT